MKGVYEVLESLAEALGVSLDEVHQARHSKRNRSGGFKEKIYLEYVEMDEDNPKVQYFLERIERYEEIEEE